MEEEAIIEGAIRKNIADPETIIPPDPESEIDKTILPPGDEQTTNWF